MTQALVIPTDFADISELAEGLVERVDEQRIILYGPQPYKVGMVVPFSIQLGDGSTAIEGSGVVAASVDGGDDRHPDARYDLVFESLDFDDSSYAVYQRMLLIRASMSENFFEGENAEANQESTGSHSLEADQFDMSTLGFGDEPRVSSLPPSRSSAPETEPRLDLGFDSVPPASEAPARRSSMPAAS